jgi:predicted nucleic acid-binding protein
MTLFFADTFYWSALLNSRDDWHLRVLSWSQSFSGIRLVTTDEVLVEFLNFFSGFSATMRQSAAQRIQAIYLNPYVQVISQTRASFLSGLSLYTQRPDKQYSLTDCISMQTMRRLEINQVLTHDKHFTQEGFTILFP